MLTLFELQTLLENNKDGGSESSSQMKEDKLTRSKQSSTNYFPLSGSKIYGKRSKLGGAPDWLQGNKTPICKNCHKKMTFYGQLDSYDQDHMIGDLGMIYVFYCFDCGHVHALTQSH